MTSRRGDDAYDALVSTSRQPGGSFYLSGVSEHEFGHVIGLCHVNNPSSLMYPSFGACENKSSGGDENSGENALCY